MTNFDYTKYLLRAWVQQWTYNFGYWADLMTNNYEPYANPYGESPERECYESFWTSINIDDIYTKEFIEELLQMKKDVESGKVKTYPMDDVLKIWGEDAQKYYD